jgi:porin
MKTREMPLRCGHGLSSQLTTDLVAVSGYRNSNQTRVNVLISAFLLAVTVAVAHGQDIEEPASTQTSSSQPDLAEHHVINSAARYLLQHKYLLGDWNGQRSRLEERGVTFDFYYTDDALANPYGGRADAALWGRIRGSADVDFSKFTRWQGLTLHATGLWQYGTNLSSQYTGTLVNSSSLPSAHTVRLDSVFLQQYLLHHKLAIRVGQIAAYDTYGNSEYGASYINLVMGYAHSNLNQAVTFAFNPAGVPSFEIKVLPTNHFYVKAMVQSEERDPYVQDHSGFAFHFGGPVLATEAGYLKDPPSAAGNTTGSGSPAGNHPGVYKIGAGYNPHNFIDPLNKVSSPGNYLLYGQIAQAVYRMGKVGSDRNRGLDLIYGEDWAPGDVTQNNHQIMAGGRWIGLFGGSHSKDTLGLGYVWSSTGSHFRESQALAGKGNLTHEHLIELNYQANIAPWFSVQPVAQWYVQPGGDARRGTVFVTGFRTKVTF